MSARQQSDANMLIVCSNLAKATFINIISSYVDDEKLNQKAKAPPTLMGPPTCGYKETAFQQSSSRFAAPSQSCKAGVSVTSVMTQGVNQPFQW